MIPGGISPPMDAHAEISALIATLHDTEQRLEQLTAGEVDTVMNRDGRTLVMWRAQEHLRHADAARQAAILNALPAHIALLDSQGTILSVNAAWVRFARANAIRGEGDAIGLNYLEVCDAAGGADAAAAGQVAVGIRAVLSGEASSFSLEYPCHSPASPRWFVMAVTPLSADSRRGAVVMHVDVTAERLAQESLRASEARFRQMAENIREVFFLTEVDSNRMLYISPAYEQLWGRTCASLYANPESWTDAIHPEDRAATHEKYKSGILEARFEYEYRMVRADGAIRWMAVRGFPVRDDGGKVVRVAGIVADITERRAADEVLRKRAAELERFHRMSVGREMQMIELKKEVNTLAVGAGRPPPYSVPVSTAAGRG